MLDSYWSSKDMKSLVNTIDLNNIEVPEAKLNLVESKTNILLYKHIDDRIAKLIEQVKAQPLPTARNNYMQSSEEADPLKNPIVFSTESKIKADSSLSLENMYTTLQTIRECTKECQDEYKKNETASDSELKERFENIFQKRLNLAHAYDAAAASDAQSESDAETDAGQNIQTLKPKNRKRKFQPRESRADQIKRLKADPELIRAKRERTAEIDEEIKRLARTLAYPSYQRLWAALKTNLTNSQRREVRPRVAQYCLRNLTKTHGRMYARSKYGGIKLTAGQRWAACDTFYLPGVKNYAVLHCINLQTRFSKIKIIPKAHKHLEKAAPSKEEAVKFLSECRAAGILENNLLADRGGEWRNSDVLQFAKLLKMQLYFIPTAAHWCNGITERRHRTLKEAHQRLLALFGDEQHLECLEEATNAVNETPTSALGGLSPYNAQFLKSSPHSESDFEFAGSNQIKAVLLPTPTSKKFLMRKMAKATILKIHATKQFLEGLLHLAEQERKSLGDFNLKVNDKVDVYEESDKSWHGPQRLSEIKIGEDRSMPEYVVENELSNFSVRHPAMVRKHITAERCMFPKTLYKTVETPNGELHDHEVNLEFNENADLPAEKISETKRQNVARSARSAERLAEALKEKLEMRERMEQKLKKKLKQKSLEHSVDEKIDKLASKMEIEKGPQSESTSKKQKHTKIKKRKKIKYIQDPNAIPLNRGKQNELRAAKRAEARKKRKIEIINRPHWRERRAQEKAEQEKAKSEAQGDLENKVKQKAAEIVASLVQIQKYEGGMHEFETVCLAKTDENSEKGEKPEKPKRTTAEIVDDPHATDEELLADPVIKAAIEKELRAHEQVLREATPDEILKARKQGLTIVPVKLLLKLKRCGRCKARIVVLGFLLRPDNLSAYAPTPDLTAIKALLSLWCNTNSDFGMIIADAVSAFLQAPYPGSQMVLVKNDRRLQKFLGYSTGRVLRCINGLSLSPVGWALFRDEKFRRNGWRQSRTDSCVWFKNGCVLIAFIDNFMLFGMKTQIAHEYEPLSKDLKLIFEPFTEKDHGNFMRRTYDFLGIELTIDEYATEKIITFAQTVYAKKVVTRFDGDCPDDWTRKRKRTHPYTLEDGKNGSNFSKKEKDPKDLTPAEAEKLEATIKGIQELRGALQYLVMTRPDIICAMKISTLLPTKEQQLVALKNIVRYIRETISYGIIFRPRNHRGNTEKFGIVPSKLHKVCAHTDASWCWINTLSGVLLTVNQNVIHAVSLTQAEQPLSSSEAENCSVSEGARRVTPLHDTVFEFIENCPALGKLENPPEVSNDNKSAVEHSANNPCKKLKHCLIRETHAKQQVDDERIRMAWRKGEFNRADGLTKILVGLAFQKTREKLGVSSTTAE
jgi:hypothetical protein